MGAFAIVSTAGEDRVNVLSVVQLASDKPPEEPALSGIRRREVSLSRGIEFAALALELVKDPKVREIVGDVGGLLGLGAPQVETPAQNRGLLFALIFSLGANLAMLGIGWTVIDRLNTRISEAEQTITEAEQTYKTHHAAIEVLSADADRREKYTVDGFTVLFNALNVPDHERPILAPPETTRRIWDRVEP